MRKVSGSYQLLGAESRARKARARRPLAEASAWSQTSIGRKKLREGEGRDGAPRVAYGAGRVLTTPGVRTSSTVNAKGTQ